MSPHAAPVIDHELDDQWRSIDNVLDSLAQRSRARRGSDEEEEPAFPAPSASPELEGLRLRLDEVTRERDELRERLVATERRLRSARATIRRLDPSRVKAAPAAAGTAHVRLLGVIRQHLRRRRSDRA
jgi:hypothetical protein